jgi:zona occludens toxin (predicted ATPase)
MMSDSKLMQLFSEYTAWQNFAATQQAEAEVEEAQADAKVRYVEAQAMVSQWGGAKDKVTVAKAELTLNDEVEKTRQAALVAYAKRKMTQVMHTNCERAVFVVSRELSRRIGNAGSERRSNRWTP